MVDPLDILWVGAGTGASPVFYYRMLLPASILNQSYESFIGDWPKVHWCTGLMQDREGGPPTSKIATFENYKLVVLQQPRGQGWLELIKGLKNRGIKVIVEVDDYLHGISEKKDHDYRKAFTAKFLSGYERCFRAADAMIVSTDYIAERYARFNRHIHVCYNGLDTGRYRLTKPPRETINIGWAGATGHKEAIVPWLQGIANVMGKHENTCFVTIGQNFADAFKEGFGNRALSIPFSSIEQYPGAMTMFDIALAPSGKGSWYRGKSDLRFLEAGALGTPIIADPLVYPNIDHGINGFHARSPIGMESILDRLVSDGELRASVGAAAQHYVLGERSINVMAAQWTRAFEEVLASDGSPSLTP